MEIPVAYFSFCIKIFIVFTAGIEVSTAQNLTSCEPLQASQVDNIYLQIDFLN